MVRYLVTTIRASPTMSLMGYTEEDAIRVMAVARLAKRYVPDENEEMHQELNKIYDFFDQLIIEGRV